MKPEELEAIKQRCDAANTRGPWEVSPCGDEPHAEWDISSEYSEVAAGCLDGDAEFIAHARTDVPALVAEVEKLKAALAYRSWKRSGGK